MDNSKIKELIGKIEFITQEEKELLKILNDEIYKVSCSRKFNIDRWLYNCTAKRLIKKDYGHKKGFTVLHVTKDKVRSVHALCMMQTTNNAKLEPGYYDPKTYSKVDVEEYDIPDVDSVKPDYGGCIKYKLKLNYKLIPKNKHILFKEEKCYIINDIDTMDKYFICDCPGFIPEFSAKTDVLIASTDKQEVSIQHIKYGKPIKVIHDHDNWGIFMPTSHKGRS